MKLILGIDIGWAEDRDTCGVAANAPVLPAKWGVAAYPPNVGAERCFSARASLPKIVDWLAGFRQLGLLDQALLVLDGPLGAKGPPSTGQNRWVDAHCQGGDFQNRCVAGPINGGGGPIYVAATYAMAFAATARLNGGSFRMQPTFDPQIAGPQLFETNPTVGLGVSVQMELNTAALPARGRPKVHATGEQCTTKSDWYWLEGGGQRVADVTGAPTVAGCLCHEQRAGLFCLAVGLQIGGLAADATQADWVGDPSSGIFCLLGPVHPTWNASIAASKQNAPVAGVNAVNPIVLAAPPPPVAGVPLPAAVVGTCGNAQCGLNGHPIGFKSCPLPGCGYVKQNQTTWGGIDAHFHQCAHRPHGMTFAQYRALICNLHWP